MSSYKELFKAHSKFINEIPFIKLGEVDNLQELVDELELFYKEYATQTLLTVHPTNINHTGVDVLSIYDYGGQDVGHYGEAYLTQHQSDLSTSLAYSLGDLTYKTDNGQHLPKICNLVESLLDHPGRARISQLAAHKHGGWHGHGYNKLLEITLHIPLISTTLSQVQVGNCSSGHNNAELMYQVPETYHTTHFKPGEIWMLNGMHSHRIINDSDHARTHVWIQSYFFNPQHHLVNNKLLDMLIAALAIYQGPYIKK
jgi:hypothetical protein